MSILTQSRSMHNFMVGNPNQMEAPRIPTTDFIGYSMDDVIRDNPVPSMIKAYQADWIGDTSGSRMLKPEEANKMFGGLLHFEEEVNESEARFMFKEKMAERKTQMMVNAGRDSGARTALYLATGLVGSNLDPVAMGANFIPFGRAAMAAGMVKQIDRTSRGMRMLENSVDGALGAGVTELFIQPSKALIQADYTVYDSIANIGFGTGSGAVLSGLATTFKDSIEFINPNLRTNYARQFIMESVLQDVGANPVGVDQKAFNESFGFRDSQASKSKQEVADAEQDYSDENLFTGDNVEAENTKAQSDIDENVSKVSGEPEPEAKAKEEPEVEVDPEVKAQQEAEAKAKEEERLNRNFEEVGQSVGNAASKATDTKTQIYRNPDQAPDHIKKQYYEGLQEGEVREGFVDVNTGEIIIFTDNIDGRVRGVQVWLHEAVGHYGVEKVLGEDFSKLLGRIQTLHKAELDEFKSANGIESDDVAAMEMIAQISEHKIIDPNLFDRVSGSIRDFLTRTGMSSNRSSVADDYRVMDALTKAFRGQVLGKQPKVTFRADVTDEEVQTGRITPIEEGEFVEEVDYSTRSIRETVADVKRTEAEQKAREEKLSMSDDELRAQAEDRGITLEEYKKLLKDNFDNNKSRLKKMKDFLETPEAKQQKAQEKERASGIRFSTKKRKQESLEALGPDEVAFTPNDKELSFINRLISDKGVTREMDQSFFWKWDQASKSLIVKQEDILKVSEFLEESHKLSLKRGGGEGVEGVSSLKDIRSRFHKGKFEKGKEVVSNLRFSTKKVAQDAEARAKRTEQEIKQEERQKNIRRRLMEYVNAEPDEAELRSADVDDPERLKLFRKRERAITAGKIMDVINYLDTIPGNQRPKALRDMVEIFTDGYARGIYSESVTKLESELGRLSNRHGDLLKMFKDNTKTLEIFRHLHGNKNVSADARAIANTIQGILKDLHARGNRAGGYTGYIKEYVTRQIHDVDSIIRSAEKALGKKYRFRDWLGRRKDNEAAKKEIQDWWKQNILPMLDHKRTFGDKSPDRVLDSMFDGIWTGLHGDRTAGGSGRGESIAARMSAARQLHFKDGDSAYTYFKQMGGDDLNASIIGQIQSYANNIALMENFGPDYRNQFKDFLYPYLEDQAQSLGSGKMADDLAKAKRIMNEDFDLLEGSILSPENATLEKAVQFVRGWVNTAKLGSLIFTSSSDISFAKGILTKNGIPQGDALMSALAIPNSIRNAADREVLKNAISDIESFTGAIANRMSPDDIGMSRKMSKMQHIFFSMSGMNWWNRTMREAVSISLVRHLGNASMHDLSYIRKNIPELANRFQEWGIGELEWDAMRSTAYYIDPNTGKPASADGKTEGLYVTQDQIRNISDAQIKKILEKKGTKITKSNINAERDRLATIYSSYMKAQIDDGVLSPRLREQRQLNLGQQAGTPGAVMVKLLTHFKSFPMTIMNRVVAPNAKGMNGLVHLAQLAAYGTAIQAASIQAQQILNGRTARAWNDMSFWTTAFIKAGSMGILADVIFNDWENPFNTMGEVLTGPSFGLATDVMKLGTKALTFSDTTGKEAVNFAKEWTPGANHFMIKPFAEYLIWRNVRDMVDPKWNRRVDRFYKNRFGQKYIADEDNPYLWFFPKNLETD